MGFKSVLTAACVAVFAAGVGAANAAPVFVQSVESFVPGEGNRAPDGFIDVLESDFLDQALNRVNAVDKSFLSLGLGGSIVLGFGTGSFVGTTLFEVTNNCGEDCGHWTESVKVYFGNSPIGDWTLAGTISNKDTPVSERIGNTRAYSLNIDTPFSFLRLVDTSEEDENRKSNAGWDIDAVSVAPIPVPAALPLLLVGLGGIALVGRRRNKAA